MYNQDNLPLSFKKVWKKFFLRVFNTLFFFFIFILAISVVFLYFREDLSLVEPRAIFYVYLALWLSIIGLIFTILFSFLYEYYYYKMYKYDFKEDDGQITKGVFTRATGHVRYAKFQNIYVDQDFWDRVFGLYDVHYETAGETSGFYSHIDGLEKANSDKLVDFLSQKTKHSDNKSDTKREVVESSAPKTSEESSSGIVKLTEINRQNCPISKALLFFNFIDSIIAYLVLIVIMVAFYFIGTIGDGNLSYHEAYDMFSRNWSWLMPTVIGVGIFYIVVCYIYNLIFYRTFYFNFSNEKGEIKRGVVARSTSYLYYDRIQNININKGLMEMIFGVCSVSIETAGEVSSMNLSIPALKYTDAENLRNFLSEKAKNYKGRI